MALPRSGVLMGIDWGIRRVGISVCDPTRMLARPLKILERKGDLLVPGPEEDTLFQSLDSLARENKVSGLVFGVPYYHLSGDANPRAPLYLETGRMIGERLLLPVVFFDEGQTSERARELMPRKKGKLTRKAYCDDLSAVLLLQGYLDEQSLSRSNLAAEKVGAGSPEERSASGR